MAAESTTNLASDAFRKHYDTLYSALASQPDTVLGLTAKLYKRVVITQDTRNSIQLTTGITPGHRASRLLLAVESSFRNNRRNLRQFIRVLRKEPTLKSIADELQQSYRTLVAEVGQVDRSSSESETEGTELRKQGKEYGEGEVTKAIEKFEIRFRDLVYCAQDEIEQKRTSVKKFRHTLTLLPLSIRPDHLRFLKEELPNIVKSEKIDEIFLLLNLYWSFIDYHLLEVVITGHGSESLKAEMEKYVCDLAEFRRNTTIEQVCVVAKTWLLRQDLPQHFSKLTTKFSEKASDYTLQDLEDFRKSFCRELSLSESTAMLAGVVKGSVIILWHIPTAIFSNLTAAIHSLPRRFFEQQQLVEIDIDGQCLFSAQQTLRARVDDPAELSSLIPPLDGIEEDGDTALIKASGEGHTDTVKELLRAQVNVNIQNQDGDTALTLTSWKGHIAAVKELLAAKANVNMTDRVGNTALIKASREGHTAIVKALLRAEADINMQNEYGDTALHWASYSGHYETVEELLKSHANINILNSNHGTALMEACSAGHSLVAILLIRAGIDVNIQSERGSTALLIASLKGMTTTVAELLEKKADVNIRNEDGLTPLSAATQENHAEIVKLLSAGAADTNIREMDTVAAAQTHGQEIRVCQALQELPPAKQQTKAPDAGDTNKPSRTVYRKRTLKDQARKFFTQLENLWRRVTSF